MFSLKTGICVAAVAAVALLDMRVAKTNIRINADSLAIKRHTDSVITDLRQKINKLNMAGLSIDDIQYAPEGNFLRTGTRRPTRGLPSFYRVALTSKPTAQSDIKIEVWLPEKTWNGRFLGTGNGGGGDTMPYGT